MDLLNLQHLLNFLNLLCFSKLIVKFAKGCFNVGKSDGVTIYLKVRNERITRAMSDAKYEEFCKAR